VKQERSGKEKHDACLEKSSGNLIMVTIFGPQPDDDGDHSVMVTTMWVMRRCAVDISTESSLVSDIGHSSPGAIRLTKGVLSLNAMSISVF